MSKMVKTDEGRRGVNIKGLSPRKLLDMLFPPTLSSIKSRNIVLRQKAAEAERRAKLAEEEAELHKRIKEADKRIAVAKPGGKRTWVVPVILVVLVLIILAARGC